MLFLKIKLSDNQHMKSHNIKHVWFDLGETINKYSPEFTMARDDLKHQLYSEITGKPIDDDLKTEYLDLYKNHHSNSGAFTHLGKPSDFWQIHLAQIDKTPFYAPDERVYKTLDQLKDIVPISLFSNIKTEEIIRSLNIIEVNPEWFTNILSGDDVANRKPHVDGFHRIVELSQLPAQQILYVGDKVNADILPAKAVGLQTCLVWDRSDEADYSFENFAEILELF